MIGERENTTQNYSGAYSLFKNILSIIFYLGILFISSSCERPVSITPPDEPPPDGLLFISSIPDSAKIFVNGKDRRRITPDSITWLASADYEVTLKKDYFRDTAFMIQVTEGERTEIYIDYLSNPAMLGEINCTSSPAGAEIFLNGVSSGLVTPAVIGNLIPGIHTIKYELQDHRITEFSIIVRSSETSNLQATLVNTKIWQDYNVSNSGIPSNSLTDVFIDSRGIIWIGTLDDGLVEYNNGYWINYRESNSNIPNHTINCIIEGPLGFIWVGTNDGAWQVLPSITYYVINTRNSDLPGMHINDISLGSGNRIWFAVDGGLARLLLDGQYIWGIIATPTDSDLPGSNVTAIRVNGLQKWAGTEINGLVQFNNIGNMEIHNSQSGLTRNTISAIEIDRNDVVWVGHDSQIHTTGGISRSNGSGWDNLSHLIYGEDVTDIYVDSINQKWVATNRALYILVNNNVVNEFDYESTGLYLDNVQGICEDAHGFIWLATASDGLIRINTGEL
ncbi:two-component regulator propeller domain-containing protein [Bacteroidota bacterium]